jgi:hypothetical protein
LDTISNARVRIAERRDGEILDPDVRGDLGRVTVHAQRLREAYAAEPSNVCVLERENTERLARNNPDVVLRVLYAFWAGGCIFTKPGWTISAPSTRPPGEPSPPARCGLRGLGVAAQDSGPCQEPL